MNSNGALEIASDTFCLNTFGIVAEIALEGAEPETEWRWEVKRSGEVVAEQSAAPWGGEAKRAAIRILTGGPEGVAPGQYELLVYAGERVAGTYSFQVLAVAPRLFNLRVTDLPEPTGATPDESAFADGIRVIYSSYEYEGLCPGVNVSHAIYHEGEQIQERMEMVGRRSSGRGAGQFSGSR